MKQIRKEVEVEASPAAVWNAWTSAAGAQTFFGPKANIRLEVGGPYEILFDPEAPPGQRGAEGLKVLSYLPGEMLSFEWNAPPEFPAERAQHTFVVVQLAASGSRTRVTLSHLGFGEGGQWAGVVTYFERAWDLVTRRLAHSFAHGPVDWSNPPR